MVVVWDHCGIWQWLTQSDIYRVTRPTLSSPSCPGQRQTAVTLYYNEATWHKFCSVTNFQSLWNARDHLSKLAPNIVIIVWTDYLSHEAMQNKPEAMIVFSLKTNMHGWDQLSLETDEWCSSFYNVGSFVFCTVGYNSRLISSSPQKINNNYQITTATINWQTTVFKLLTALQVWNWSIILLLMILVTNLLEVTNIWYKILISLFKIISESGFSDFILIFENSRRQ